MLCAAASKTGPVKLCNQDAYVISRAQTSAGDVSLLVVADGMSGLSNGQVASATIVRAFDAWFQHDLPKTAEALGFTGEAFAHTVHVQWANLVQEINLSLMKRGVQENAPLGAACTAFLAAGNTYFALHVGDTRLYCVYENEACQLTRDQTFGATEQALGRMSRREAACHPLRNTLTQCVGASENLSPVFLHGTLMRNATYMLCSDGMYRVLTNVEIAQRLCPQTLSEFAHTSAQTPVQLVPAHTSAQTPAQSAPAQSASTQAQTQPPQQAQTQPPQQAHVKAYLESLLEVCFARGSHDNATLALLWDDSQR